MASRPLQPAGPILPVQMPAVLKPKACIPCRTRKVKCDRHSPCTNCTLWSVECVFPSPVRRCPRPRKGTTALSSDEATAPRSLDGRLEKVERALQALTHSFEGRHATSPEHNGSNQSRSDSPRDGAGSDGRLQAVETSVGELIRKERVKSVGVEPPIAAGNGFAASVATNQNIKNLASPSGLFPFDSFAVEVASLHPPPAQLQTCWRIYLENIDRLVKALHRPSTERILQMAVHSTASLSNGQEALLFAIYFSSIPSMTTEDVKSSFAMSRDEALMTYRAATEKALSRANFLTTSDLITLQAFALFLSLSSYMEEAKFVWALTGLARRLSSSAVTNLPPFAKEMHKRLWWQLWYLDRRAAEDFGKNAGSSDAIKDSDFPLNVNDSDLDPGMAIAPPNRTGWTEMSFCLIRFEIAKTSRTIDRDIPLYQKKKMINECWYKTKSTHLCHIDKGEPMQWLAQHVAHVLITEMWFKFYGQQYLSPGVANRSSVTRDQLFLAAIDIVDTPRRIEREPQAEKWKWLLKGYLQFLPLAFLLRELCQRQSGGLVDRAWTVAENAFARWTEDDRNSNNGRVLHELMAHAKATWQQKMVGLHSRGPDTASEFIRAPDWLAS